MELPKIDFASHSAAQGGTLSSPWNQGDVVVSYGGDATSGSRTPSGALSGAINSNALAIAGVIVVGALLWKLSR